MERAAVGAPSLTWDGQLATEASAYAHQLAAKGGGLVHSALATRIGQGENLWMGTAGRFAPAVMFDW
jgi:uncharacterized protein YkwD